MITRMLKKTFSEDYYFTTVMILLNSTIILRLYLTYCDLMIDGFEYLRYFLSSYTFLFFFIAAINLIKPVKLRRIFQSIIVIINTLVLISDIVLFSFFHSFFNQSHIETILNTDLQTSIEFISIYLLNPVILFLISATIITSLTIYKYKLYQNISIPQNTSVIMPSIIISLFPIILLYNVCNNHYTVMRNGLSLPTVIDTIFNCNTALELLGDYDEINELMNNQKINITNNKADIPFVVLILGESTDRNAMSIYGYHNKTTPHIQERYNNNEITVFSDVIASANTTAMALPQIFTFASKESTDKWYSNLNIIDIANQAGWHTVWLSNQSVSDKFGNIEGILSNRAKEKNFTITDTHSYDPVLSRPYDIALLPLLDKSLAENTYANNFYVIHLTGTHEEFYKRYPEDFNIFSENDIDISEVNRKKIKAQYDNAVLYNDHIINEIIKRFENKDSIIIFISDHGLDVCNNSDFYGHSMEEKGNYHMIEIPMLVYYSKEFKKNHIETVQDFEAGKDKPFRTDNLIHVLLSTMKINLPEYKSSCDITSNDYISKERIYNNKPYIKSN